MPDRGHVKIVLPCANEGEWLRLTVDSILKGTLYPSYEVVISANGDRLTDFSFLERGAYLGRVSLKRSEEFLGVGKARNAAVEPGDAAYYGFLDAHILVDQPDWLERIVACLEAHPDASMVQPEIRNFVHDQEVQPEESMDPSRLNARASEYASRGPGPTRRPGGDSATPCGHFPGVKN